MPLYIAVTFWHSCLPVNTWLRVMLRFFDPKPLLWLLNYSSKCQFLVLHCGNWKTVCEVHEGIHLGKWRASRCWTLTTLQAPLNITLSVFSKILLNFAASDFIVTYPGKFITIYDIQIYFQRLLLQKISKLDLLVQESSN